MSLRRRYWLQGLRRQKKERRKEKECNTPLFDTRKATVVSMKPLVECCRCGAGIGVFTYKSPIIPGEYDTSDCYVDAVMDELGIDGLKGRFDLVSDKHGGVELVAKLTT